MRALSWVVVGLFGLSCATAEETPGLVGGGRSGKGGGSGSGNDASGGASGSSSGAGGVSGGGAGGVFGSGGVGGTLGAGGEGPGGSAGSGGATGSGGAAGSSGATGSGGGTGSGGAAGRGGTSGAGGSSGRGGTSGAGGTTGSGGTSGRGGTAGTGGAAGTSGTAGTGGSGGGCPDGDGDSITDCDETGDGDSWTDPAIFNGMHVRLADQCSGAGECNENDTLNEVTQCMNPIIEERNQYSGWDWDNPPDNVCDSEYAFRPNWSNGSCRSGWAADWQGCIHLEGAGPHCFQIAGGSSQGCAALYFNGNTGTADIQTGAAAKCFNVGTGNYPIRWHYTMDQASSSSMHVRYCAGTGSNCAPSTAIPARMLRTSCP